MGVAHKELLDLFDAADVAVADFHEMLADGKIDWKDVTVLLKVSQQLGIFNAAIQGISNLTIGNLSEMLSSEVEELAGRLAKLVASISLFFTSTPSVV